MSFSPEATGVIVTLVVQTGVVIWWASKLTATVQHQHECLHRIEQLMNERAKKVEKLFEKVDLHSQAIGILNERTSKDE